MRAKSVNAKQCVFSQCQTIAGMARFIENSSVERFNAKVVINHQCVCRPRLCDFWSSRRHCKKRHAKLHIGFGVSYVEQAVRSHPAWKSNDSIDVHYKFKENLAQARWRVCTSQTPLQHKHANCTWVCLLHAMRKQHIRRRKISRCSSSTNEKQIGSMITMMR